LVAFTLGPFEGLGVVENEVNRFARSIDAVEYPQRHRPNDLRFVEATAPEELAVVGPVAVTAKQGRGQE